MENHVCRSDAHWSVAHGDYPITGLPLDVDIDVIRCGINLEIGSTYILWGYFNGWLARGDSRRSLGLYECILPVEINASDPVPRRFLDRNC